MNVILQRSISDFELCANMSHLILHFEATIVRYANELPNHGPKSLD